LSLADEIATLDAIAQAELVRSGEVTPVELAEAALERIERLNPELNCVTTVIDDAAKAAAGPLPDGPLHGVPVMMKDLFQDIAGVRETLGSRAQMDHISDRDSVMTARYRAAGAVFVGKTATPEFGNHSTTEPEAHGPTRNPWDTSRTAGGSSGGSGAAVAAGMVAAAGSSDGAGSIRIPASCCGLYGLKPTRSRIPAGSGDPLWGLAVAHAVTRSVRDSALLLDIASGPAVGDPYVAPAPTRPYLDEVGADPGRLRIAWSGISPYDTPVDPECAAAAESIAELLAELGHEVEEGAPEFDASVMYDDVLALWATGNAQGHDALVTELGRPLERDELELSTWDMIEHAAELSADDLAGAIDATRRASRQVGEFFERYDMWLTPTLAQPPLELGLLNRSMGSARGWWEMDLEFNPFNAIANMTGQPAASLPLHTSSSGLPIGTMLTARYGREDTLLQLSAQLEVNKGVSPPYSP
jgi:Asp-tRNA(Asn)/Glu-tRNA(Gln) amidotransferase A subunit family amidase